MKTIRIIAVAAVSFILISNGYATSWYIYNGYPAPAVDAKSVSWNTPFLFSLLCDGNPPRIFDLGQPANWLYLYNIPAGVWGLTRDGDDYIYVSNYDNGYIYRLSPSASLLSSFRGPRDHPADLGFSWYLAIAYPEDNIVFETTTAGSVLASYPAPGTHVTGVDGRPSWNQMVATDPTTGLVYFQGHGTFPLPEPISVCTAFITGPGVPYTHIYVVSGSNNFIYIIESLNAEGVAPASLGRIKALLR